MLMLIAWCFLFRVAASSSVLDPSLHLVPSPPLFQTSVGISPGRLWTLTRVQRHADDLAVIPIQKETSQTNFRSQMALKWYYCQPSSTTSSTTAATVLDKTNHDTITTPTSEETSNISSQSTVSYILSPKTLTTPITVTSQPTTEAEESMENAETFWPNFRTQGFGYGNIHVPLTFSISGAYSRYGSRGNIGPVGLIGSSYGSVSDEGGILGGYGRSGLAGSSYGSYGTRIYGGHSNGPTWSGWGNGKWGHYGKG